MLLLCTLLQVDSSKNILHILGENVIESGYDVMPQSKFFLSCLVGLLDII